MVVDRRPANGHWCDGAFGHGLFAAFAASPAVAQHIGKSTYYFANTMFLGLAAFVFRRVHARRDMDRRLAVLMLIGAIGGGADPIRRGYVEKESLVAHIWRIRPAI